MIFQNQQDDIEEAFGCTPDPRDESWSREDPPWLVSALNRGIGVHHAGLSRNYRLSVEKLFRRKKLGVVFATTTLAMGINMPSKTSVMIGDEVYLNAMNYRQMAGRAGRRGFDLRGHVVFMGMPSEKCFRLLRSDLPQLQGNLVMDNSLALRLVIRQHSLSKIDLRKAGAYSKKDKTAKKMKKAHADARLDDAKDEEERVEEERTAAQVGTESCSRLINHPLFNPLGDHSDLLRVQLAHCFRFSVEYLLRLGLVRKAVFGVLWASKDAKPTQGRELSEPAHARTGAERLAKALTAKTTYTCGDYGIHDLHVDDFIKSGDAYFQAAEVEYILEPSDLGAFVAHLFFMEPANFAFLTLLCDNEGQTLKYLCRPGRANREEIVLSILCHIFCRATIPRRMAEWAKRNKDKTGPSQVVLDPLSEIGDIVEECTQDGTPIREGQLVKEILAKHNSYALQTLTEYTACFVDAYKVELGADDTLPFTFCRFSHNQSWRVNLGERWRNLLLPRISEDPRVAVRSSYVALSGCGDEFSSIQELCQTSRSGLFLDPKMVPIFEIYDEETTFLNSYLLDFYKHGQKHALSRYNKLRDDTVWEDLQNFHLVLKALTAAMKRRHAGGNAPFDNKDVLQTFERITQHFGAQMRQAAA